jgi:tetratricopeptide (TPR) repeat protein
VALAAWGVIRSGALREAEAAYRQNNLSLALRRAHEILKRDPSNRGAALVAARSLSRLNRAEGAELYFRQAGKLGYDDLHLRAFGLVRANKHEEAIHAYREILDQWPKDVLALRRLAAELMTVRRNDETLEVADRLIRIPEGAVIGYTLKGVVYYNAKFHEQSVPAFERVLELDPDLRLMPLQPRESFWIYFANDLISLGRAAEARAHLTRELGDSDDPQVINLMAHAHKQEGSFEEAERCWRKVTERQPELPMPWHELGLLSIQRGDPAGAVALFQRAAALAPEAPEPFYGLSLAYRRLGRRDEAQRFHEKFTRLSRGAGATPAGKSEPVGRKP